MQSVAGSVRVIIDTCHFVTLPLRISLSGALGSLFRRDAEGFDNLVVEAVFEDLKIQYWKVCFC